MAAPFTFWLNWGSGPSTQWVGKWTVLGQTCVGPGLLCFCLQPFLVSALTGGVEWPVQVRWGADVHSRVFGFEGDASPLRASVPHL